MERTGPQTPAGAGGINIISYNAGADFFAVDTSFGLARGTYAQYRTARRHPLVKLLRTLTVAAITGAGWSVERDEDANPDWQKFIQDQVFPHRRHLTQRAVEGMLDFGWAPFERCYDLRDGRIVLDKFKALLHDITDILVDASGNFAGFKQERVIVPAEFALLFSLNVEGTNWYGEAGLEPARSVVTAWGVANGQAAAYDAKVVGNRWVVKYPPTQGLVEGATDPREAVAIAIMAQLDASGSVAVPSTVARNVDELNQEAMGWSIEEKTGGGMLPIVLDRLRYLDVNICRAMGWPETVVIAGAAEGQKMPTETAQRFAIQGFELLAADICDVVNAGPVNQLLAWNFGSEAVGRVYVRPGEIQDELVSSLMEVAAGLIAADPSLVDVDALLNRVGIPKSREVVKPVTVTQEVGT